MRETRILYELKTHHIAFAMAYLVLYRHSHTNNNRGKKMHGINAEANSTTSNHQRGSEEQKKKPRQLQQQEQKAERR